MADLYERLEEIDGVARVLFGDVERLSHGLGGRSIQDGVSEEEDGARRAYVRAIFALVEAVVEQHKLLLLELNESASFALDGLSRAALAEEGPAVNDNGSVTRKDVFLQLKRKVRLVYRLAGEVFGEPLVVRYDDDGWRRFGEALKIRDRITHPTSFFACHIEG